MFAVSSPIAIERRKEGIYLPTLDLFLDPTGPVPRAYLSHAHADHAGGAQSGVVFASRETVALVRARLADSERDAFSSRARPLDFGEIIDEAGAKLAVQPAGHVLGASQLVVDHAGGRFVYTGDVSLGGGRTHDEGRAIACDDLLIESTFGVPIFQWPDKEAETARLIAFCKESIDTGKRALVLGYALGKAQELCAALLAHGIDPVLHGAAYRVAVAYEVLGVSLGIRDGRTRAYAHTSRAEPAVVVAPPWSAKALSKGKVAVAYCSGFALIDAHVDRYRADAGFVLSDHASFDDLLTIARASGAKRIRTTHGQAEELARQLARNGIEATALGGDAIDDDARPEVVP